MSSEHLLVGGQSDEFRDVVNSILEQNPEQLQALRLLARYCSWQRDEAAFRDSLERLASHAGVAESIDDERFALSQLVMITPHESRYTERLQEINEQYGYDAEEVEESLFDRNFVRTPSAEPELETFASLNPEIENKAGTSDDESTPLISPLSVNQMLMRKRMLNSAMSCRKKRANPQRPLDEA